MVAKESACPPSSHPVPSFGYSSSLQVSLARAARLSVAPRRLAPELQPFFEQPLFDSARKALSFAVTREGNPARPYSSRVIDKTAAPGNGLSGNDAAAQAGIIMSIIRSNLGALATAVLVASASPASVRCACRSACCGGFRAFTPWRDAVSVLVDASVLAPCRAKANLREALLVRLYGRRGDTTLQDIAARLELDPDTVSKHHHTLHRWLRGSPASRDGTKPAVQGIENEAWSDAESVLRNQNVVG